jgi:hypothetical protein
MPTGVNPSDASCARSTFSYINHGEEVVLGSGLIGQRFIIESMGRSMTLLTEINNRAVVLTCFGDFTQVNDIASTISASK